MDDNIKLQKYISECGLMSRRVAETEIALGHITVNGQKVEVGRRIDPSVDSVEYLGKTVEPKTSGDVSIILNKPRGYVTTMRDEKGRPCVADLVNDIPIRVYPAGRLDMMSEGLLIMTSDGALANKLTHPKNHIPKTYHVKISSFVTPEQLKALNSPMEIDGYTIKPAKAEVLTLKQNETVLKIVLFEGRNRQIRKMCEKLELNILSLRRIAIGDILLGNLKPGKWRKLTKAQIDYLKKYKANT